MKMSNQEVQNLVSLYKVEESEINNFSTKLLRNLEVSFLEKIKSQHIQTQHFQNIELLIAGKGKPLVFLHGVGAVPQAYTRLIKQLSKKYMVVAPALPGHGGTTQNKWFQENSKGLINYVTFINEVIEKLRIQGRITFIGQNLGGNISLEFAKKYEKKVDKVVLVNVSTEPINLYSFKNLLNVARMELESVIVLGRDLPWVVVKRFFTNMTKIKYSIDVLKKLTATGLDTIKIPIEIYSAANDKIITIESAKKLNRQISNSTMHIIKNRNHNWIIDSPEYLKI